MKVIRKEASLAGRKLVLETGRLASLADSSVMCQYGGTQVLATFTVSNSVREGINYLPLMVDYEERLYAAGKIKGSRFIKREGRPTDEAVLTGRLIDRALRPLFNSKIRNDIQIVITVLSVDGKNDPDVVSLMAASVALALSKIKLAAPLVTGVRIGEIDGKLVINPTEEQIKASSFDLVVAASDTKINMVEANGQEVPEKTVVSALELAQKQTKQILNFVKSFVNEAGGSGIDKEFVLAKTEISEDLKAKIDKFASANLDTALFVEDKKERRNSLVELEKILLDSLGELEEEEESATKAYLEKLIATRFRQSVLRDKKRVDGRKLDEVRPISCEVGVLAETHGSAIFNRGTTQALSIVTLGAPGDEQLMDEMQNEGKKRYLHHYNFPPFSVGEVAPMRGPGRREIGHGALAERAIEPVLPSPEDFPYTIRVVSEILASNGSSSMASTCGSSLSLMDAGVPIRKPVAGIAMGVITQEGHEPAILTDIQGIEDHDGDMDLKVAGTKDGITVVQMDVKVEGLDLQILGRALEQAKKARLEILGYMAKAIKEPRLELSEKAPKIHSLKINPEKIGALIGPGGKIINEIIDTTGVTIDVEDDGTVNITGKPGDDIKQAIEMVEGVTQEAKIGVVYDGKIKKIEDFGLFIEIFPGKDGLLHVSEVKNGSERIDLRKVYRLNQDIKVKVKEIDDLGRVNLVLAK